MNRLIRIYLFIGCLLVVERASAQSCNDTARIINLASTKNFYIHDQITTRSGFRVYCGRIYHSSDTSALLLCHDAQGNMAWVKSYRNEVLPRHFFDKVSELRNGDFIVTGHTSDANGLLDYLLIARFDAAGNLMWHRLYKPGNATFTESRAVPLQITEDESGTIYFSFYSASYNFSAVARLAANGTMLWSRSFRYGDITLHNLAIAFMPVSVQNDTLFLAGTGLRDQFTMKLNRNTGELQSVKRYALGTSLPIASFEYQHALRVFQLPNGHYTSVARIVYGAPHEYFFMEWDEQLRLVKVFALDMPHVVPLPVVFSFLALPDGTLVTAVPGADRIYLAALNGRFQKKVLLRRSYSINRFNDNCLIGADSSGRLLLTPVEQNTMDIYQVDSFDCIQKEDTLYMTTSPQTLQERSFSFDEIASNVLEEVPATATVLNEVFTNQVVCERTVVCDALTIKGPANSCLENMPAVFTASKNANCPRKVNWQVNADSTRLINDTTIHVFFGKEWQGQIIASLEGCSMADTLDIAVKKAIPAQLVARNICIGQNDTLSPGKDFSSYLWQDGSSENKMIVRAPGTYWVQVTDQFGCTSADTVTVTAIHHPPSKFIVTDTTFCLYTGIVLQPKGDFIAWRWSTGDTTASIKVGQQGVYTLTVTDRNHCNATEQVAVTAKPCANHIYFPNAISPNRDGRNDVFRPVVTGDLMHYRLQVFNRFGRKVFESTNPHLGWNGRTGSVLVATDIYVWQAEIKFAGEGRRVLKGTVVLVP